MGAARGLFDDTWHTIIQSVFLLSNYTVFVNNYDLPSLFLHEMGGQTQLLAFRYMQALYKQWNLVFQGHPIQHHKFVPQLLVVRQNILNLKINRLFQSRALPKNNSCYSLSKFLTQ